jgi:hypothetical protein
MTVTAKVQPLCHWCGKPLAKASERKYLVTNPEAMKYQPDSKLLVERLPQTKAEAQKLFNRTVISVKRCHYYSSVEKIEDIGIDEVNLWDGESYKACWDYFCTNTCAAKMGRAAVRDRDLCGPNYNEARRSQAANKETKTNA